MKTGSSKKLKIAGGGAVAIALLAGVLMWSSDDAEVEAQAADGSGIQQREASSGRSFFGFGKQTPQQEVAVTAPPSGAMASPEEEARALGYIPAWEVEVPPTPEPIPEPPLRFPEDPDVVLRRARGEIP